MRIVPGTGTWTVNGRALDEYFPNKLHQQLVNEPFVLTQLVGQYDVIARIHGGGLTGQAGALRLGVSRALNETDVEANRPIAQEGRHADPRRADQGAQEGRAQEGPQGAPVQQALIARRPLGQSVSRLFGTDGVRGVANRDLTAELALDLVGRRSSGSRPGRCLIRDAGLSAVVGRDPRASRRVPRGRRRGRAWRRRASTYAGLGVLPTPGVAYLTAAIDADFGVMISASHNPMPDNGIKFFARGGLKLDDDVEEADRGRDDPTAVVPTDRCRTSAGSPTSPTPRRATSPTYAATVDHSLTGSRSSLDCAEGAASLAAPHAFRAARCRRRRHP